MDFLQAYNDWVKGEVFQAKVMILIGVLLIPAYFWLYKSGNPIGRGMLIPVSLCIIVLVGYGSYVFTQRPKNIPIISQNYESNQEETVRLEQERALKERKNFTTAKIVWGVLMLIAVLLFFVIRSPYANGLMIGLMLLAFTGFNLDSFLHYRLEMYYNRISLAQTNE